MRALEIAGKRFNRLTVLRRVPGKDKQGHTLWMCRCDCGKEWVVRSNLVRNTRECHECANKTRSMTYIPNRGKKKDYCYIPDCGERTRDVLNDKNVNLADMARKTGISRNTIYSFVYKGTDISTSRLAKICAYLGVSADYILGLKGA